MKASSRFLSAFLVLALMLSCSAFASGTGTTAVTAVEEKAGQEGTGEELFAGVDSTTELFLSLTEGTSKSLAFPLTEEQAALAEKAGADKVIWTLHRLAPYANPVDGNFIPLHGEEKMYPNEKETIDFATIRFNDANEYGQPFSMERFETTLDGSTLKLDFTTTPVNNGFNDSIPHESGGRFLDICGEFTLTASFLTDTPYVTTAATTGSN